MARNGWRVPGEAGTPAKALPWIRANGRPERPALGRVRDRLVGREAAEGVGLDLADTLARDPELLADLLERVGPVSDEPEAERDHVALPLGQLGDGAADRVAADRRVDLVLGGRAAGCEQIAEARVAVGADRRVGRGDRAGCLPTSRTCESGSLAPLAISSSLGGRPSLAESSRSVRVTFCSRSTTWTGIRIVRALLATPRWTAWRIHQVA